MYYSPYYIWYKGVIVAIGASSSLIVRNSCRLSCIWRDQKVTLKKHWWTFKWKPSRDTRRWGEEGGGVRQRKWEGSGEMEKRESGYKIKPGAGTYDSPLLICMPSRERDAIEYLRRPKQESTLARCSSFRRRGSGAPSVTLWRRFAWVLVSGIRPPPPPVLRLRE